MEILIERDLEAVSAKAAQLFWMLSEKYKRSSSRYAVALSGGETPKRLYQLLASARGRKDIPWNKVHIFMVDERFVPPDHPDSNFRLIQENLLQSISLPVENIHRMRTDCSSANICAKNYEAAMMEFFKTYDAAILPRFDLMILGIGEDGHTASLFPGSSALSDREHLVAAVRKKNIRHQRITMTLPVLNNARNILFIATGERKSFVLNKVVMNRQKRLPASLVNPENGKCHFFLDRDAAGEILHHSPAE